MSIDPTKTQNLQTESNVAIPKKEIDDNIYSQFSKLVESKETNKINLNFDVNRTIICFDKATKASTDYIVNSSLAERAQMQWPATTDETKWNEFLGILEKSNPEVFHDPTFQEGLKRLKNGSEKADTFWNFVEVAFPAPKRPKEFKELSKAEQQPILERENVVRKQHHHLLEHFSTYAELFIPNEKLSYFTDLQPVKITEEMSVKDLLTFERKIKENVEGLRINKQTIFNSFYYVTGLLQKYKKEHPEFDFHITFRTFGKDLPEIVEEVETIIPGSTVGRIARIMKDQIIHSESKSFLQTLQQEEDSIRANFAAMQAEHKFTAIDKTTDTELYSRFHDLMEGTGITAIRDNFAIWNEHSRKSHGKPFLVNSANPHELNLFMDDGNPEDIVHPFDLTTSKEGKELWGNVGHLVHKVNTLDAIIFEDYFAQLVIKSLQGVVTR